MTNMRADEWLTIRIADEWLTNDELPLGQKGVWGFSAAPPSPRRKRAEKLLKSPRRLLPLGLHLSAAEGLLAR